LLPNHKYNQYTDDDLIAEYKRNQNQQIIGELYARYGHLVFGVCLKIIKNRQDCEDLTMQIFQNIGTKVQQHTITYFKSWLYQLTRNECLMLLRKTKKNPEFELNENIHVLVEQSEQDAINIDCFEVNLVEAMKALKEEQRLSLDLFYKQEKSYVQIAQETHWELNKVKSYIQNAKRNLKILLQKMCNGKYAC
jgi:RNA polymerase sigma factor (sigma-70 family)